MFFQALKKKVKVFLFDEMNGWRELKTSLEYSKSDKIWYLKLGNERIPAPENVMSLGIGNKLFVMRKGLNSYSFLNMKNKAVGTDPTEVPVPPSELYTQITKAAMRLERMKSTMERMLPIIFMAIGVITIGVFIAIVWSSTASSLQEISKNFAIAMEKLESVIAAKNQTSIPAR